MLRKTVVMLLVKEIKRYEPIGSGILVFHDGKVLVVSAAHVLEQTAKSKNVYLFAGGDLFSLNGVISYLLPLNSRITSRRDDAIDIGAFIVPDTMVEKINGSVNFVQSELIEKGKDYEHIQFYQAIGFPAAKNLRHSNKSAISGKPFIPECVIYSGKSVTYELDSNYRFAKDVNIEIEYNGKHAFDDDGKKVNTPDLHGLSGGLIQGCFDYMPHSNGFYHTCASGMLIEMGSRKKSLIGVRFGIIYEWLDLHSDKIK